jgi:hypothetical protein
MTTKKSKEKTSRLGKLEVRDEFVPVLTKAFVDEIRDEIASHKRGEGETYSLDVVLAE